MSGGEKLDFSKSNRVNLAWIKKEEIDSVRKRATLCLGSPKTS